MNKSYEERAREENLPIQYSIYKGIKGTLGAMRFNLKRPYTSKDPKKTDGVIFLEMCPAIGKNVYDWEKQKMVIALGISDIPKVILYLRAPTHPSFAYNDGNLKIIHDKGAGTANKGKNMKTLEVKKPEDMRNFMFTMYEKNGDQNISAAVTVSPDEAIVIGTLLQSAIPTILSWT